MKRTYLLFAALLIAFTLRAEVIDIDLNTATEMAYDNCSATFEVVDDALSVNYTAGGWEWAGVEFPIGGRSSVSHVLYEYKGDGAPGFSDGIVLYVYLRDSEGNRWTQGDYWPNLMNSDWVSEAMTPNGALDWDAPGYAFGDKPFVSIGFVANPGVANTGSFSLRNIKLTVSDGEVPVVIEGTPKPLSYNGDYLPQTDAFVRTRCGAVSPSIGVDEVSGIACSRVTPGYIWMESDNYGTHIVATDEQGQRKCMQVNLNTNGYGIRYWDWEDMSGGVYEGVDYLFIGAFGDNKEEDDFYSIVYFEEPAITEGESITITPNQIRFAYPDGKSHNCEALMYDNREQMLYIITKVYYDVCKVYSLPFRLNYGSAKQTLTYVCDLGLKSDIALNELNQRCRGFHLVTAADISPDGNYVLIKNHNNIEAEYSWILYWEREGDESIAATVKRQPKVLDCYEYEWQGEAICWLNSNTFYTTSDSDGEPPIYKYTRRVAEGLVSPMAIEAQSAARKVIVDGQVLIIRNGEKINVLGTKL